MKRFFYTTAAVVAFAFSGMANTIEVKSENVIEKIELSFQRTTSTNPVLTNEKKLDCLGIFHDTYWIWRGRGADEVTSLNQANRAKSECENYNNSGSTKPPVGISRD